MVVVWQIETSFPVLIMGFRNLSAQLNQNQLHPTFADSGNHTATRKIRSNTEVVIALDE
jgi:hypothetical protein